MLTKCFFFNLMCFITPHIIQKLVYALCTSEYSNVSTCNCISFSKLGFGAYIFDKVSSSQQISAHVKSVSSSTFAADWDQVQQRHPGRIQPEGWF